MARLPILVVPDLNKDKVRWLTAFMVKSGLLIETSWSSVQAKAIGLRLIEALPLAEPHLPEAAAELELSSDLAQGQRRWPNRTSSRSSWDH